MEHVVLEHFKRILEKMLAELERPLRRRDQIAIENTPDALDEVQNAAEREFAIRQLEHESSRFRNVKAALRRIEEGTYGECVHCESGISIKRLEAVPWTPYCLVCQGIVDRNTTEAEQEVVQFTDQGPKIMRAGQAAKTSAAGQSQSPLFQEPRSAGSASGSTRTESNSSSPASSTWPQKKRPGSERLRQRTKHGVGMR